LKTFEFKSLISQMAYMWQKSGLGGPMPQKKKRDPRVPPWWSALAGAVS